MPITTRGVLALISALLMLGAIYAFRTDRDVTSSWLMAAGFAVATLWTVLGVAWAYQFPEQSSLPWRSWAMLAPMALVFATYYGYQASQGEGLL
jgi:hypothetical protein